MPHKSVTATGQCPTRQGKIKMTYTQNDIAKVRTLVEAGVAMLKAEGWTEAQIAPKLRFLADEAIQFLLAKEAA